MPWIPARLALRRAALLAAAAVCLLGTGAGAAAADVLPPEGVFEGCALDTQMSTCLQRLQTMHQGGIQVVVIAAWAGSLDSLSTYAQAAHSMGMSVMWELSNPIWWRSPASGDQIDSYVSGFASACGCTQNGAVLDYMIHWLAALPGTYGYYAADDSMLASGDRDGVAAYVSRIKRDDPVHTVMIGSGDARQASQYQGISDMFGTEIYPVLTSSMLPMANNRSLWGGVAQAASSAQNLANQSGKQSAFILQAFTWGDNLDDGEMTGVCQPNDSAMACYNRLLYPTAQDQLELRNEVLLHSHPKLILWWSFPGTYGQAGDDTYSIYPTGTVAANRWQGLSAAIQAPPPSSGSDIGAVASRAHGSHRHHNHRHHRRHHHHHRRHHRHRRHRTVRHDVRMTALRWPLF